MASKVNVPRSSLEIVRRSKDDLTNILLSKYNCDVTISGVDFDDDGAAASRPSVRPPERRFETTLHSGVAVSVWRADLTNFPADVVVNAANENLLHIGGLALALSKAGGARIDRDSRDHVRTYGAVHTGTAVMMNAGSLLPCKKIIHAVGPRVRNKYSQTELPNAERLLERTVCSIIDLVEKDGLRTVAIPAISSGIFNFPLRNCAETIVRALSHARGLKEILLVNIDEPTVREMERACKELDLHTRGASSRMKANTVIPTSRAHFGNVRVTVKKGPIEDEQVRTCTLTPHHLSDAQLHSSCKWQCLAKLSSCS